MKGKMMVAVTNEDRYIKDFPKIKRKRFGTVKHKSPVKC